MAGIGFELKKLFRRKGLFASLRAYGYAGIICTGPMLLGVALQLGILLLCGWVGAERAQQDLLVCMITYTLLFSLTVTSFFSMPVTRYLADMLYEEQEQAILPSFKSRWIRLFYMLSEEIYRRAFRVSSLFYNARRTQIEMGCDGAKCIVIPNGVQYQRFCDIPLKEEDGWVDIGAVVRLAPIKDVKTMIYAFFELASRVPNVRLHIMGGVDDEGYANECYALVEQLQIKNLLFTGRVDVVQYMQKLDFTILTSISEGQPLSVLESMAARRPCVTTEVGCCRELLEGAPGDTFGIAGYCVPPMYRQGLADAMEKMCASRARREEMGRIGQKRVDAYFHHEQMLANYQKMYDETAKEYHLE